LVLYYCIKGTDIKPRMSMAGWRC